MLKTVPGPFASLLLGALAAFSTPCGCVTALVADGDFELANRVAGHATAAQHAANTLGFGEVGWWLVPRSGSGYDRFHASMECLRLARNGWSMQTGSEADFNTVASTQDVCRSYSRAEATDAARLWRHASSAHLRSAALSLGLEHLFLGLMLGLPTIAALWTRARQPADGVGRRTLIYVAGFGVIGIQLMGSFTMFIGLSTTESMAYLGLCALGLLSAAIMLTEVIWFAQPQVQRANAGSGPTPLAAGLIGVAIIAVLVLVGGLRAVLLAGGAGS